MAGWAERVAEMAERVAVDWEAVGAETAAAETAVDLEMAAWAAAAGEEEEVAVAAGAEMAAVGAATAGAEKAAGTEAEEKAAGTEAEDSGMCSFRQPRSIGYRHRR